MKIDKKDKIVEMLLLTSQDTDYLYKRPDSTTYVRQVRKDKEDVFLIPEMQLELPLANLK